MERIHVAPDVFRAGMGQSFGLADGVGSVLLGCQASLTRTMAWASHYGGFLLCKEAGSSCPSVFFHWKGVWVHKVINKLHNPSWSWELLSKTNCLHVWTWCWYLWAIWQIWVEGTLEWRQLPALPLLLSLTHPGLPSELSHGAKASEILH